MQTPGISPNLLAIIVCSIMAGATVLFLGWLVASSDMQCPADTGRVPARLMDGRTVCVMP